MRITATEAKERALLIMRNAVNYINNGNDRMAHVAFGAANEWADLYFDITDNYLVDDNYEFYELIYKYEKTYLYK